MNAFLTTRRGDRANLQPDLCGPCGGACCKRGPGMCLPWDFAEPLRASLVEAFLSGKFRAMPYKGVLLVSPRTVHSGAGVIDPTDGQCALLSATGCSLSAAQRPSQCRSLVPFYETVGLMVGPRCFDSRTENHYINAWTPHQRTVLAAVHDAERRRR